ncbi:hypothetical protein M404DRAFT_1003242 [Pisolithus tinctorius Marx 270]|uniref:Uncharacterized protein n=1 Tax=Pisolithus tinctorius Marx 270 TaxID=870435 RepID=A0A0C3P122_PISTI|nr:hypothetical protein M404DRAFT_1003242 [Pisolithus tinctorius Marx 270]
MSKTHPHHDPSAYPFRNIPSSGFVNSPLRLHCISTGSPRPLGVDMAQMMRTDIAPCDRSLRAHNESLRVPNVSPRAPNMSQWMSDASQWACNVCIPQSSGGTMQCNDNDSSWLTPHSSFSAISCLESELSDNCVKDFKLWAQKVASKFVLKAAQFLELSMFIDVGRKLNATDLWLWIWQQATNYKMLNGIEEIKVESASMKTAMQKVTSGLKGGFQLSADQMMQVAITCKDMLIQAGCTKYKMLHVNVEDQLKSHTDTLGFQNMFGNLVHEQVLYTMIKKECSGIQSKFCTLILESTGVSDSGKGHILLKEFTWTVEHQLHFAYLCFYGRWHQYVVGPGAESRAESGKETGSPSKPPAKHAKLMSHKAPPGRVKTGRDFWSAMDHLFIKDIEQYGKDMKNEHWCE